MFALYIILIEDENVPYSIIGGLWLSQYLRAPLKHMIQCVAVMGRHMAIGIAPQPQVFLFDIIAVAMKSQRLGFVIYFVG